MRKIAYILREMWALVKAHRLYLLTPLLLALAALSILVYYVGPTVIITFIYAGV